VGWKEHSTIIACGVSYYEDAVCEPMKAAHIGKVVGSD